MERTYPNTEALMADPPDGAGFAHEGRVTFDPWRDPSGGSESTPAAYGFRPEHTGGGCMALAMVDEDGVEVLLTGPHGAAPPEEGGGGGWLMGAYRTDTGDELWRIEVDESGRVTVEVA